MFKIVNGHTNLFPDQIRKQWKHGKIISKSEKNILELESLLIEVHQIQISCRSCKKWWIFEFSIVVEDLWQTLVLTDICLEANDRRILKLKYKANSTLHTAGYGTWVWKTKEAEHYFSTIHKVSPISYWPAKSTHKMSSVSRLNQLGFGKSFGFQDRSLSVIIFEIAYLLCQLNFDASGISTLLWNLVSIHKLCIVLDSKLPFSVISLKHN